MYIFYSTGSRCCGPDPSPHSAGSARGGLGAVAGGAGWDDALPGHHAGRLRHPHHQETRRCQQLPAEQKAPPLWHSCSRGCPASSNEGQINPSTIVVAMCRKGSATYHGSIFTRSLPYVRGVCCSLWIVSGHNVVPCSIIVGWNYIETCKDYGFGDTGRLFVLEQYGTKIKLNY